MPGKEKSVTGPWTLTLDHVNGISEKLILDSLVDFVDDERLKTFAGVALYETSIEITGEEIYSHVDLGVVKGVSEAILNGQSLGVRWYGWHRYNLDENLKVGENKLQVRVTIVLGNYLKSLEDNPIARRWVAWQKYHTTGMIGPVNLLDIV